MLACLLACKLHQRGLGLSPSRNLILVHFSLKIRHLVATILMIFLRVLSKIFLWPHYSGAPGARGPRFTEPPEPPVPIRHWRQCTNACSSPRNYQVQNQQTNKLKTFSFGMRYRIVCLASYMDVAIRRCKHLSGWQMSEKNISCFFPASWADFGIYQEAD